MTSTEHQKIPVVSWTGVVAIVLALVIGSSYFYQVSQESNKADCQARYNAAFTKSLSVRSDAANARLDALDALLTGFLKLIPKDPDTPRTPEEEAENRSISIKLFTDYGNAVVENAKVRAENPLPALPDC